MGSYSRIPHYTPFPAYQLIMFSLTDHWLVNVRDKWRHYGREVTSEHNGGTDGDRVSVTSLRNQHGGTGEWNEPGGERRVRVNGT